MLVHFRAIFLLIRLRTRHLNVALYLTGAGGSGIWYQCGVALAARILRVRLVYHHHSFSYLHEQQRAMRALVTLAGAPALHVTLCPDMEARLLLLYPGVRRSAVCSNMALLPLQPPSESSQPHPNIRLGHVSNLSVEKGLSVVLGAHAATKAHGQMTQLHIAGPLANARSRGLLEDALSRNVDGSLVYHGSLTRDEIKVFFQGIDIFLFPSAYRHEAEPLVVLEALAAGVPVLAFAVGCLASTFSNSRWLVTTGESYEAQLNKLLDELERESPLDREGWLRAAAADQRARFGPSDMEVIWGGLGV